MKQTSLNLPGLLAITGQTNSGKTTTAEVLEDWGKKQDLRVHVFGSGDLIRTYEQQDSELGQLIRSYNSRGELTPLPIISKLVKDYMDVARKLYDHLILHGSPRFVDDCDRLCAYVTEDRFFKSLKILEILAPDEHCYPRAYERTQRDKRLDSSLDGQPGVPDPEKIRRKMNWWNKDKDAIRKRCQELGVYLSVENTGDIINLKNQLCTLFVT